MNKISLDLKTNLRSVVGLLYFKHKRTKKFIEDWSDLCLARVGLEGGLRGEELDKGSGRYYRLPGIR